MSDVIVPHSVVTLPNRLKMASHPKWLYASAWLEKPEDSRRYDEVNFHEAPDLVLNASLPSIPVRMDKATLTFMRSRNVSYAWEQYMHEDTGQWRVRITGIHVDTATGDATAVRMSWDEFLPRFLSQIRQYRFDDEVSDDDDDEEEDKKPRRSRLQPAKRGK